MLVATCRVLFFTPPSPFCFRWKSVIVLTIGPGCDLFFLYLEILLLSCALTWFSSRKVGVSTDRLQFLSTFKGSPPPALPRLVESFLRLSPTFFRPLFLTPFFSLPVSLRFAYAGGTPSHFEQMKVLPDFFQPLFSLSFPPFPAAALSPYCGQLLGVCSSPPPHKVRGLDVCECPHLTDFLLRFMARSPQLYSVSSLVTTKNAFPPFFLLQPPLRPAVAALVSPSFPWSFLLPVALW